MLNVMYHKDLDEPFKDENFKNKIAYCSCVVAGVCFRVKFYLKIVQRHGLRPDIIHSNMG